MIAGERRGGEIKSSVSGPDNTRGAYVIHCHAEHVGIRLTIESDLHLQFLSDLALYGTLHVVLVAFAVRGPFGYRERCRTFEARVRCRYLVFLSIR